MAARSLAAKDKGVGTSPITASFGSCADCPAIWRAESSNVAILREIRRRCFIRCSVVQNLRLLILALAKLASTLAPATTALKHNVSGIRNGNWPVADGEFGANSLTGFRLVSALLQHYFSRLDHGGNRISDFKLHLFRAALGNHAFDHVVAYAHDNMGHDATEFNLSHFSDQPIPRRQGIVMFSF